MGIYPVYSLITVSYLQQILTKSQRCNLPDLGEISNYLEVVRKKVFQYLETVNLKLDIKLCYFIIQHESQHYETICSVLEIIKQQKIIRRS